VLCKTASNFKADPAGGLKLRFKADFDFGIPGSKNTEKNEKRQKKLGGE